MAKIIDIPGGGLMVVVGRGAWWKGVGGGVGGMACLSDCQGNDHCKS